MHVPCCAWLLKYLCQAQAIANSSKLIKKGGQKKVRAARKPRAAEAVPKVKKVKRTPSRTRKPPSSATRQPARRPGTQESLGSAFSGDSGEDSEGSVYSTRSRRSVRSRASARSYRSTASVRTRTGSRPPARTRPGMRRSNSRLSVASVRSPPAVGPSRTQRQVSRRTSGYASGALNSARSRGSVRTMRTQLDSARSNSKG